MKKIFILTGEPSGDKLASTVISKLKQVNSEVEYSCVGGHHLESLGIKSIYIILMVSALAGSICGVFIIYYYKKNKNFQIPYGCFIVLAASLYPDYGSLIYNLI